MAAMKAETAAAGLRVILAGRCGVCGGDLLIDRADSGWGGVQRAVCLQGGHDNIRKAGPAPAAVKDGPAGDFDWDKLARDAAEDFAAAAAGIDLDKAAPATRRKAAAVAVAAWLTGPADWSAPLYDWGTPGKRQAAEVAAGQLQF